MKGCDREGKDGMNLLLDEILKKKFKVDRDTDWERFYEEIKKEVER